MFFFFLYSYIFRYLQLIHLFKSNLWSSNCISHRKQDCQPLMRFINFEKKKSVFRFYENILFRFFRKHNREVRHWCWVSRPGTVPALINSKSVPSSSSSPDLFLHVFMELVLSYFGHEGAIPRLLPQHLFCWSIKSSFNGNWETKHNTSNIALLINLFCTKITLKTIHSIKYCPPGKCQNQTCQFPHSKEHNTRLSILWSSLSTLSLC